MRTYKVTEEDRKTDRYQELFARVQRKTAKEAGCSPEEVNIVSIREADRLYAKMLSVLDHLRDDAVRNTADVLAAMDRDPRGRIGLDVEFSGLTDTSES